MERSEEAPTGADEWSEAEDSTVTVSSLLQSCYQAMERSEVGSETKKREALMSVATTFASEAL